MTPHIDSVQCLSPAGLHHMSYKEWGAPDNPKVLLCVHGLTRSSGDFDTLAQAMANDYRVVCPDIVGRGHSDWLSNPALYAVPQYVADIVTLLARIQAKTLHYFGTSMGGLIGMGLAALKDSPVQKLLLNDIGPSLDGGALARIATYVGTSMNFPSFAAAEQFVRTVSAPFGPHTDEQWHQLTANVMREKQGQWTFHYDPAIAINLKQETLKHPEKMDLWWVYDPITCPVLVVRGETSDLLLRDTYNAMAQRGPHAKQVEIAGVGHAPTFMSDAQIKIARDFFLG